MTAAEFFELPRGRVPRILTYPIWERNNATSATIKRI